MTQPEPDAVITSVDQVTPEWLTAALTSSGALAAGSVAGVEPAAGIGNWSSNAILRVHYSVDAKGARPASLFLKMVSTDTGDDEFFGESEVAYYIRDYVDVPSAPLVRCHHAAYSEADHAYHLLLDDVSASHFEASGRAPTLGHALALADGMAALHARWWDVDQREGIDHGMPSTLQIRRFVDLSRDGLRPVLENRADDLADHWPDLIRSVFDRHPAALIDRSRRPAGFTIIHGDPGAANILVPRQGDRPLYLIDRQPFDWSLTTWLGVYDLVYAAVLDWPVADRRRLEQPLLRRYHQQLRRHGVTEYSWTQLVADYRLMIPMGIYVAVEYCRDGSGVASRDVWLPYLQRTLTACDDHGCSADSWPQTARSADSGAEPG